MARRRGEETNGKAGGGETPAGALSRSRACLIVSLIVLVWNVGAFGRRFFSICPSTKPIPWESRGSPTAAAAVKPAADCTVSRNASQLSVRQKLLLGRKIDINRGGVQEISELPGISENVATAVVETRKSIGGFRVPEDMLRVRGIKEKRLKKILPFLEGFINN